MRRSSKILSMILMLALLVGATVTAVFAAEEQVESVTPDVNLTDNGLYASGIIKRHSSSSDFEGTEFSSHWKLGTTGSSPAGSCANTLGSGKNHGHFDSRTTFGNTYAAFWYDCNETMEVEGSDPLFIAYTTEKAHDAFYSMYSGSASSDKATTAGALTANSLAYDPALITNDYMVWDLDICSDKYLVGEALKDTLAEGETGKLAYAPLAMNLMIRSNSGTSTGYYKQSAFRISSDANGFYFQNSSFSEKAYLADKPGVWNHITLVAEIDNRIDITIVPKGAAEGTEGTLFTDIKFMDAVAKAQEAEFGYTEAEAKVYVVNNAHDYHLFSGSKLHAFVNGKYLVSSYFLSDAIGVGTGTSAKDGSYYSSPAHLRAYEIRVNDGSTTANRDTLSYSTCFDNITTHYYKSGYSAAATGANTLQQYISSGMYSNTNLAYCNDIVYNTNYLTPNPNTPVANVTVGETVTPNYTGILTNVAEGATVTVADGEAIYIDSVAGEIFVVTEAFDEVILSASVAEIYKLVPVNYETNTYRLALKSTLDFTPIDYTVYSGAFANGYEIGEAIANGKLTLGGIAEITNTVTAVFEKNPAEKDGVFMEFDSWWMTYKLANGDNYVGPARMIGEEIVANNKDGITFFPHYKEVKYAYSIIDAETGMLVEGFDYTKANAIASSVNSAIALKEGDYIVTLYTDVELKKSTGEAVGIKATAGRAIYFDLNGKTFVSNLDVHNAKASSFYAEANAEFYLYSSKEGGRAFNFTYFYDYTRAYGAALIGTSGSTNPAAAPKIYCGTVDKTVGVVTVKADGDNLWTSSALLIEAGTSYNYYNVYNVDETGAIIDLNNDGKITSADKKANATTYYNEIYIDGGTYTRANADGGGLVKTNAYLDVDIKNATLIAANIFATDSRYNPRITGTVDNTICYAMNSSVFGQFCEGSTLTFTNSTLLGGLGFAGCTYNWSGTNAKYSITTGHPMNVNSMLGEVYLGEGCKIYGNTTAQIKPAEGVEAVDINEGYYEETVWYVPTYTIDTSAQGTFNADSITTPTTLTRLYVLYKGYTAKGEYATFDWISAGNTIESVQVPVIGPVYYAYGVKPSVNTDTTLSETNLFKLGVDHWTVNGQQTPSSFVLKAEDTVKFTAVMGGIVKPDSKSLSPLLQTQETRTKFTTFVYVPKYAATTVVVDGVTYEISESTATRNSSAISGAATVIDGKSYFKYTYGYPAAIGLAGGSGTFVVSYNVTKVVDPADRSKDVTEKISFTYYAVGLGEYLERAFEAATTDVEKKLIANIMQYCIASYDYYYGVYATSENPADSDRAAYNSLKEFYAAESCANYATDVNSAEFNAKVAGTAAKTTGLPAGIEDYVQSITYYNAGGVPTLAIVPVNNVVNGKTPNISYAKIDYKTWGGAGTYKSLPVAVPENSGYTDAYGNTITGQRNSKSTGYLMDVNGHLAAYDINNVFTFSISTVDISGETPVAGETYTFTYTLADYILELEAAGKTAEAYVMKTLAAYGEANVNYIKE